MRSGIDVLATVVKESTSIFSRSPFPLVDLPFNIHTPILILIYNLQYTQVADFTLILIAFVKLPKFIKGKREDGVHILMMSVFLVTTAQSTQSCTELVHIDMHICKYIYTYRAKHLEKKAHKHVFLSAPHNPYSWIKLVCAEQNHILDVKVN